MNLWDAFMFVLKGTGGITISKRFIWNGCKEKNVPPEYIYFKPEEVVGLDPEYVAKLDMATAKTAELSEEHRRVPFIITSGLRTPEKNQSVGGIPTSSHLKGLATDLLVGNSHDVWVMVAALTAVGITRIVIYVDKDFHPVHLHNDVDPEKISQVIAIKQEVSNV